MDRGARVESNRVRVPRRRPLPQGLWSWVHGDGLASGLTVATHSDAGSFLVAHTSLSQDGFQQGGFWEDTWTGVSSLILSLPDSSSWWWLISSVLITRVSCCEITHPRGYCGPWRGEQFPSVSPLTEGVFKSQFSSHVCVCTLSHFSCV